MPPRTRKSNQDADYTVYFSENVLKQVYFPNKRKVVRKKPGNRQDVVAEPRQLRFLPERMRIPAAVGDSEGEDEVDEEELTMLEQERGEGDEGAPRLADTVAAGARRKGKKRTSGAFRAEEEDAVQPAPKRRRALRAKSKRTSRVSSAHSASDHASEHSPHGSDSPAATGDAGAPRLSRRQSRSEERRVGKECPV